MSINGYTERVSPSWAKCHQLPIAKYEEELGLATAHEHRIADEYAQVYAEKEARGRVIDSLHQEATMWMDRFALTLNGS